MSDKEGLFQLVVVGSSAGGIEALSTIFKLLPKEFPLPVVIAQHLDPHRPSHLAEILSRRTQLPVITVETSKVLMPSTIYVVPSNRQVRISPGEVLVLPNSMDGPKPSIDLLLSTAAEVYGEKLIAVILTGTGSDGTSGAEIVSETGGTVIIQNPATAAFPGMPQSLAPQTVDIVAELTQISGILSSLASGRPVPTRPDMEKELQAFLFEVREKSNQDFRAYKPATILRRLQRRIAATSTVDLSGYKTYLQTHPEEYDLLVKSFLIKVTEFMRDPEFFTYLGEQILPELIVNSEERSKELRFWSAGCATGEEAYSLAILLAEALGPELPQYTIKIFATDLDTDAIAFARRGIYPKPSLQKLSEKIVSSYFNPTEKGYELKKQIRSLVIFGEHDLGRRAPFPHIDLVLCRNVLIYFSRELQQHTLRLFTYALREGGYLSLGRTETVNPQTQYFTAQEPRLKVYRRLNSQPLGYVPPSNEPVFQATSIEKKVTKDHTPVPELAQLQKEALENRYAKSNLLLNLPIGVVVVNRSYHIQEINLTARRLIGIHSSAIGEDLVHLAEQLPNRELLNAISSTLRDKTVHTMAEVEMPNMLTGEPTFLQLSFYPQVEANNPANGNVLILITDVTQSYQVKLELKETAEKLAAVEEKLKQAVTARETSEQETQTIKIELEKSINSIKSMKQETDEVVKRHASQMETLVAANDRLLVANEEQATNNAELRRLSEDFLLRQEEAQAANEEAETLNEEMQATNEELETLNEEMQATVEELNTSNADLAARGEELEKLANSLEKQKQQSEREREQLALILASMQDAVLVVSPDGKPLVTNDAYQQLFEKSGDVQCLDETGKILSDDETPIARAAKGEKFSMLFKLQLGDQSLRWCEAVGHPLGSNSGGVVVIRDTTERELAEKALLDSNLRTTKILESISDAFFALDSQAVFTYVNTTAEITWGKKRDALLGKKLLEVLPELIDSTLSMQLNKALKELKPVRFETFSSISHKWLEVKAYPSEDGGITVYFSDISQRKLEEKQRLESLGILAGGIAHDFNNVLAIITGNLGLIKLEVGEDGQKDSILSLLDDVESAAYRASGLTHQLLTFSSGGKPIKKTVQLPPLLKEWLQFNLVGTKVEYQLDCSEDLWPVELDEGQFSQVINNLITNATHSMPAGGKLEVKVENIVLVEENKELPLPIGNYIKLQLKDYGSGIKPEILNRIFEPYFTTRPQGHGLGLAMVFSIVRRHGGFVEVESVVEKGSTFTIYLPAAPTKTESGKISTNTGEKPGDNRRVLILEDEKMLQNVLTKLLKKLGYETEITEEGSKTVKQYQKALKEKKPYSLLILDLGIPEGKGGQEVINELLQVDPTVKAIVSSGYNSDPVLSNFSQYGFIGVLNKPYTLQELKQVLNTI